MLKEMFQKRARVIVIGWLSLANLNGAHALASMDPATNPSLFLPFYGQSLLRTLLSVTLVSSGQKIISTLWDACFLSSIYPKVKRWGHKHSVPDSYYMATEIQSNGLKISDLILNKQTYVQVNTFILALKDAIANGTDKPSAMFHGPPGVGKTEIAKRLVEEGDFEIRVFSGGALLRLLPKDFEHLFRWLDTPKDKFIIVVIDEVEALLRASYGVRSDQMQTFLTARGTGSQHYAVVATTNFVEQIDEAAHRRFAFQIEVPLPDEVSRPKIFSFYLKRTAAQNDLTFEDDFLDKEDFANQLIQKSEGLSGSDIENICLNVAGEAKLFNEKVITRAMLVDHIQRNIKESSRLESKRKEAETKRRDELVYRYYETVGNDDKKNVKAEGAI